MRSLRDNRRKPMAVDRPADDDPEEISRSRREKQHEHGRLPADGMSAETEIAEPRTRAEYYQALRAAVDQQVLAVHAESTSADTSPRSAWNNADALTRPPLEALRMPPERAIHILYGDATGGGHRYGTSTPCKTEFPASWDDDRIVNAITFVARSPENVHQQWNQRWKARGEFDNVRITVIIEPDGTIWTAWPEEGSPGVVRNPEAGAP
jgi:Bacterial EndoU nuclease